MTQLEPSLTIRPETPDDIPAIHRVNLEAFGQPAEAELVDRLRERGGFTLSLVAVRDGQVVGHILFSPVRIESPGSSFEAQGLGPMAVVPGVQREGIGSRLVEAGLEQLRQAGHEVVVVLGHAEYYPRFGFRPSSRYGIRWEKEVPEEVFMVIELRDGALGGRGGVVRYRPEFDEV